METETMDRLFLELSQFTRATTRKELEQQAEIERLRTALSVITATDCYSREEVTEIARAALAGKPAD
jgi:hypothetical protein